MRRVLLVAVLALLVASGCMGTVAKQAFYGATGASARYFEIKGLGGETALDRYSSVSVEVFDASPMLGAIPSGFPALVQTKAVGRLVEMKVFQKVDGGPPAAGGLVIRGRFMDYDAGGSALRAVGFGVDPFLTAQIEVVDAASGRVLGVAMVTGTVKSAARTGPQELADGVGKAIKGLLERHHSKPQT